MDNNVSNEFLAAAIKTGFDGVDKKLTDLRREMNERFDNVEGRLANMENRLNRIEDRVLTDYGLRIQRLEQALAAPQSHA